MFVWNKFKFFFFSKTFVRFLLVGLLNTAFGLGIYCFFIYIELSYKLAVLLSTVLGVLFNFKTIGTLVFKNKNNRLILRFILSYIIIYFINIGLIKLLLYVPHVDEYWAGILVTPIIGIMSFVLHRKLVFVS
ncbi:GtrA family protein [uncultured Bacteroides sp.]|uniref:GtrA family protein n=1 Tax=uncultured Bacteroides sp. TaxID=162156 RepID=UPI00342472CE